MKRVAVSVFAAWSLTVAATANDRPNIIVVMTDDQGYGDLGHTGNPVIQTPHLDALAAESSTLTDYHVAPTCSPTRSAFLTGHWTDRTGAWHTINGRSLLRENEVTIAKMLADAGYATGHFGKWHLGDSYPFRPHDRGFQTAYYHGGGGAGHTPDCWDNAYFDGRYFQNGTPVAAKGFCTDVFFAEAQRFIRERAAKKQPFFAYVATNAAHDPLHCPEKYMDLYRGHPAAAFLGMITNIDDNIGALRVLLEDLGIAENTILIFTTDNGTAGGAKIFNAGMRGAKGSVYDGGHRVPFIAHWPAAGWNKKHSSGILCHAVDIVPTLLEAAGVEKPEFVKFDGIPLQPLLDPEGDTAGWPADRMLVTDSQRIHMPQKWRNTAVMSGSWRLVNGTELYDTSQDPGQTQNVAKAHPDRVRAMTAFYDAWWAELEPGFAELAATHVGHPEHPDVSLSSHDWFEAENTPWNQRHIRQATLPDRGDSGRPAVHEAYWAVKVLARGRYRIRLRRWPTDADHPITAGLPSGANVPGTAKAFRAHEGRAIPIVSASLRIDGAAIATATVPEGATHVDFDCALSEGLHRLSPVFIDDKGNEIGAYYCIVSSR